MGRLRHNITKWTQGRAPGAIAARAAGVIVIAVVPGALVAWIAYRVIRGYLPAD
jgi:hypothetical protein